MERNSDSSAFKGGGAEYDAAPLPRQALVGAEAIPAAAAPMRVLLFSRAKRRTRVPRHLIRGLEANGHRAVWLHSTKVRAYLGDRLGGAYLGWRMRRFKPDLVLIYSKDIPRRVLEAVPAAVPRAVYYEDALDEPDPGMVEIARGSTHLFTTARGWIEKFRGLGIASVHYLRGGVDSVEHHRVEADPEYASELAFIGIPRGAERIRLLKQTAEGFELKIYGRGWEKHLQGQPAKRQVFLPQFRKICASAGIILGIDYRSDLDLYFSNRTWLVLGCGGFLLTKYIPNLEEFFHNHRHLVWFHDDDECLELARYYSARGGERRRISGCGHEYVHRYHTFKHAAAELIARVYGGFWPEPAPDPMASTTGARSHAGAGG